MKRKNKMDKEQELWQFIDKQTKEIENLNKRLRRVERR